MNLGAQAQPDVLSEVDNPGLPGTAFVSLQVARLVASEQPARQVRIVTERPATDFVADDQPNLAFECWYDWAADPNDCVVVSGELLADAGVRHSLRRAGRNVGWSRHPFDRLFLRKEGRLPTDAVVSPGAFAVASNRVLRVQGVHIPHPVVSTAVSSRTPPSPDGAIEFVFMSSGLPIKGFWDALIIWRTVHARLPRARLHIIGRVPSAAPLAHEVSAGSVVLHGEMGVEKREVLERMHVGIVNPRGLSESWCSTAFELMAHGVPIVSSGGHGMYESMRFLPELVAPTLAGQAGRAVALVEDPARWLELSDRSRAAVDDLERLRPAIALRWGRLADGDGRMLTELRPMWVLDRPRRRLSLGVLGLLHYRAVLRRRWRRAARSA